MLYPVAIHYKGSGFYSTDYGKKGAAADKKESGGDSAAPKTDAKPAASETKKPAAPSSD